MLAEPRSLGPRKTEPYVNGYALPVNAMRATKIACVLWVGLLVGVMVLLSVSASKAEAQTLLKGVFRGNAYGTYANAQAGPVAAELGRSAFIPCPCQGTGGKTLSNTVDSLSAGGGEVLTADEVLSTVFTDRDASSASVKNTSTVSGLHLLDGLITADAVKAVANTSANSTTITSSPASSTFVNLKVAGESVAADVAPNTRLDLPGVGSVVLKSVKRSGNGKGSSMITVEMVAVEVTQQNSFGLPVGAKIIVAHAVSGFSRTQLEAVVGGQAYAATANAKIGDTLKNKIGKAAAIYVGCQGTRGETRTNNIAALDAGNVLSSGTGTTIAFGGLTPSGTVAQTTATVEDLRMVDGLISADTVKVVAQDTFKNGERISSTQGSQFTNLRVADVRVGTNVAPNTRINLPGIGYVVVNEQKVPSPTSTARLQVNGLHVFVTTNNLLGLPVGSQIIVAHADSTAVRFL
jgi:hypothetical protein